MNATNPPQSPLETADSLAPTPQLGVLATLAFDQSATAMLVFATEQQASGRLTVLRPVLANQVAETVLGQPRSAWLQQPIEQAFPAGLSASLYQQASQLLTTAQRPPTQLVWLELTTAPPTWIEVASQLLADSPHILVSLTSRPGGPPSTPESAEARYFQVLASSIPHMGVLVIDPLGVIDQALGILPGLLRNRQPDELVGQPFLDQVVVEYRPDWERYLATARDGEAHFFSDHWNAWRCECYVGPVPGPTGPPSRVLVVFRNVTEQYRQQQALQVLNRALEQSNQRLERFAAVASHDLQEPLRKIQLFSQLLQQRAGGRLEAADVDRLSRMHAAAGRLSELIESLLTLAQFNGPMPVRTLIDLTDIIQTISSDLSVSIQERSAIVVVVPPLPVVPGDEPQLRQLFQNLITNALKFTAPGVPPRVRIQARLVDASRRLDLALAPELMYTEVSVTDNGIGIASADVDQIFSLFSRLHGRQRYAGVGIGLATVKQVVDNHGGAIRVDSQLAVGTTMRVYLPLAPTVVA